MSFDCVLGAWREYEGAVRAYLSLRLRDPHLADDALQDVWLNAMEAGKGLTILEQPRPWLFRVAHTVLIEYIRRSKQAVYTLDESVEPEPRTLHSELASCLNLHLDRMTPQDREIIEAIDLRNGSLADFASSQDLTVVAVKSRLSRARQRLRDQMVQSCHVRFDAAGRVCCQATAA